MIMNKDEWLNVMNKDEWLYIMNKDEWLISRFYNNSIQSKVITMYVSVMFWVEKKVLGTAELYGIMSRMLPSSKVWMSTHFVPGMVWLLGITFFSFIIKPPLPPPPPPPPAPPPTAPSPNLPKKEIVKNRSVATLFVPQTTSCSVRFWSSDQSDARRFTYPVE